MVKSGEQSFMRNLGAFFGHIIHAVKTDPAKKGETRVVRQQVEEEDRGDVILRRTTIDEIEMKQTAPESKEIPPDQSNHTQS